MSDERANDLELGVEFRAEPVVVAVSGDLDMLTAAVFAGVLNAMVDAGHRDLVVDVGGVTFIGAAGVGVFAGVLLRLSPMGGTITLRSASERVRRVSSSCCPQPRRAAGSRVSNQPAAAVGVTGALVTELVQDGHVDIDDGRIRLTGTRPADRLLAEVLDNLAAHAGKKLKSRARVADGLPPFAEGTDGGGSIRIPAAWCGIHGLSRRGAAW